MCWPFFFFINKGFTKILHGFLQNRGPPFPVSLFFFFLDQDTVSIGFTTLVISATLLNFVSWI